MISAPLPRLRAAKGRRSLETSHRGPCSRSTSVADKRKARIGNRVNDIMGSLLSLSLSLPLSPLPPLSL